MGTPRLSWRRALGATVVSAALGSAGAQPAQSFETLVNALDAPELAVRESASVQLAQGDRFPLQQIERALTEPSLSAEQRQRLRWVGQQLFARSPRAALGVSFVGDWDQAAVVEPVTGFDTERVLRAGDILASIGGHRVVNQPDVRQVIISYDPGDEVTLGIIRSGTPMTVTVKMGRLADLPAMGDRRTPAPQHLAGAWTYRLARLGEPRPAPVDSPLAAGQWRELAERTQAAAGQEEPMHDPFTGEPVRSVMLRPPVSSVVMGGQNRGAPGAEAVVAQRAGPVIFERAGRANVVIMRDLDRAERDRFREQREQLLRQIEINNARINDPSVPEAIKAGLRVDNDRCAMALQVIDARIRQLGGVPEVRP